MGLLTAIVFAVQVALGFLPNIELVTLLFILYTLFLGKKVFFIIFAFIFLEGIFYGFGIWWVNYLYIPPLQALITLALRKHTSVIFWSMISGIYGFSFGALCAIPYFFIGGTRLRPLPIGYPESHFLSFNVSAMSSFAFCSLNRFTRFLIMCCIARNKNDSTILRNNLKTALSSFIYDTQFYLQPLS